MLLSGKQVCVCTDVAYIVLQAVILHPFVNFINPLFFLRSSQVHVILHRINPCPDALIRKRISHVVLIGAQPLNIICMVDDIRNVVNVLVEGTQRIVVRFCSGSRQQISCPFLPRAEGFRSSGNVHRQLLGGKIKAQLFCHRLYHVVRVIKIHVREVPFNIPNRLISVANQCLIDFRVDFLVDFRKFCNPVVNPLQLLPAQAFFDMLNLSAQLLLVCNFLYCRSALFALHLPQLVSVFSQPLHQGTFACFHIFTVRQLDGNIILCIDVCLFQPVDKCILEKRPVSLIYMNRVK